MLLNYKKILLNYKKILLSILVITLLDVIFLSIMSKQFSRIVKKIQNVPLKLNYYSVITCYMLMILGYNYFILLENKGVIDSFIFGIVIYGIYETTTMSIFKDWDFKIAIIDTIWGGLLFSLTTLIINNI
tara:strand:+ start:639 stop:1028 length:390 start_codon:yes stop_codon:yes gene_type:complete